MANMMLNFLGAQDPIGGMGGPPMSTTDAIMGGPMGSSPASEFIMNPQNKILHTPNYSRAMLQAGIALISADEQGYGVGGGLAAALANYNKSLTDEQDEARQRRRDALAEYEIMSRIEDRQLERAKELAKQETIERLKKEHPELADVIELSPEKAAGALADRGSGGPFGGTSMDAQTANMLLTGDPSTPDYLAAYNLASQPKRITEADGSIVTISPDMSAYRKPTFTGYGGTGAPAGSPPGTGGITYGDPRLTQIQGYDIEDGARPTTDDAKQSKAIIEAHNAITELMKERKNLIDNATDFNVGSKDAEKIQQNTNQILLKVKNLEQTGALDQGSVDVIGPAIGDPINRGIDVMHPISSTRRSMTKSEGGKTFAQDQFQSGQDFINTTLSAALKTRGYRPATAKPAAVPTQPQLPAGGILGDAPGAIQTSNVPMPKTQADFDALPSGTEFINPANGQKMRKR